MSTPLVDMISCTTHSKTTKHLSAEKVPEKLHKSIEPAVMCHSRSGRIIKRKRFDDEVVEVGSGRKTNKQ
uniref:Uncharacterized protein n=1 Tax=Arion vulgaris TaxID=1028688 RepID=A0A0B6Y3V3_9EUPU